MAPGGENGQTDVPLFVLKLTYFYTTTTKKDKLETETRQRDALTVSGQ